MRDRNPLSEPPRSTPELMVLTCGHPVQFKLEMAPGQAPALMGDQAFVWCTWCGRLVRVSNRA